MSNYTNYGTLTADGSTAWVAVRGWATLSAHYDSGTGTLVWEFKGPDGETRSLYGGSAGTTLQSFTANHMINQYFGGDCKVRVTLSSSSTPQIDWQVIGSVLNRG
jgi:hypothetical protein